MLQSGSRRVRERAALGLAGALHIAAIVNLWAWAIHRDLPSHRAAAPRAVVEAGDPEVEVELDVTASVKSSSQTPLQTPTNSAKREPTPARKATSTLADRAQRTLASNRDEIGATNPPGEDAEVASSAEAESQPAPPVGNIDVGLGPDAWQRWISSTKADAPTGESAARRADRRPLFRAPQKSTTGGLQEGLEAHDRALGLGPSGPVISALYNAAHASIAPETGVARFQVTVLDTGSVEVRLSEASDRFEGWHAVASAAADALRRAPPRIPTGRSGMRLAIEIRAEETFPNGLKPKQLRGPRLKAEPPRFRSNQAAQANLKDRNPVAGENKELAAGTKANVDLPGIYLEGTGKVCSYSVGVSVLGPLLGGGCDLSNIGTKPQRIVRTLVREEVLF